MPSSPKFRHTAGNIRVVEVFLVVEAGHQAHADGHVRVGGEVQIDLQRVCQSSEPGGENCHSGKRALGQQNGIRQRSARVCKQSLLSKSDGKSGYSRKKILCISFYIQFSGYRLKPDDRSCNTLMEQSRIEQNIQITLSRFRILSVHINNICHKLECIERDAYRECYSAYKVRNLSEQ